MMTEYQEIQEYRAKGFSFTLSWDGNIYVFFDNPATGGLDENGNFMLSQNVYEGNDLDHAFLACDAFLQSYYGDT